MTCIYSYKFMLKNNFVTWKWLPQLSLRVYHGHSVHI